VTARDPGTRGAGGGRVAVALAAALALAGLPVRGGAETAGARGAPAPASGTRATPASRPARPGHADSPAMVAARIAMDHLGDEEADDARKALEPVMSLAGEDPAVSLAAGVLRLHEQRYDEAVALLEKAAAVGLGRDWLDLARNARDVTKGYLRAESDHFAVSHPKGKEAVLVPYLLEALEAQRAALEKDLGWVPPGKVTVEVLEGTRQLARLSTLTEEEIKTSGTIAICKFGKMMVTSPKALVHGYEWIDTAAHEYVHHVVTRRTRNRAPIWLHEGIARWHESRWRGPGGDILSPWSAALLRDAARRGKLITFEEMHPSMAKLPSQEAAALAFAEVAVAVDLLKRKGGPGVLVPVLDEIAGGRRAEDAVARALGIPFPAFLEEWKRQLATRPLPEGGEHEMRRLRFQGDPKHGGSYSEWSELPDEQARRFARLGEILRERGRWEAARVEYGKAVKRSGSRSPALAGRFALASMMAGRDADAEKALAEALRGHPDHAGLHVQKGRLHLKAQQWDQARQSFLLANRVDPFDPEIHAGLARAAEAVGDAATADREKKFTKILVGHGE
jgi:tetratricopeptide (TPR) repeat protein